MNAREQAEKIHRLCFEEFRGNSWEELVELIRAELQKAESRGMRMAAEIAEESIVQDDRCGLDEASNEAKAIAFNIRAKADELEAGQKRAK